MSLPEPVEYGTPEQQARRRAAQQAARDAAAADRARQKEADKVAEEARRNLPARVKKQVTEDAQKKIRQDIERERNIPQSQRNLRAITALRMRRNGATNLQIAHALGLKHASSVSSVIGNVLKEHQYDRHEVEVYRDFFLADLIHQGEIAAETIQNPGYLYDVKGELIMGPDGGFLVNISERTKAQTEWRHIQESARKLLGVDAPQKKVRKDTVIIKNIGEIARALGIQVDDMEADPDDIVEGDYRQLSAGDET